MSELLALYERNKQSAEHFTSGALGIKPKLNTIILTCLDARVDPAHFFGLQPGEALVMRNGGGRGHQHEVGRDLVGPIERRLTAVGLRHNLEPVRSAEDSSGGQAERRLVVDHQHADRISAHDPIVPRGRRRHQKASNRRDGGAGLP